MNRAAHCAAIIPCLNEAKTIQRVVAAVRTHVPRVYVVDDGSTDDSAALAAEAGAVVLSHGLPLGKGTALQAGLGRAAQDGFSWAVTLDADGQHEAADLPRLLEAGLAGAELVVGNRMNAPNGMPRVRLLVNRWMSRRLSSLARQTLPDSQCGYRLVRLDAYVGLRLRCQHFEFESEMLLAFARAGHRIRFVDIQTVYADEQSKIRPLVDTVRWFKWWLREAWSGGGEPQLAPVTPEIATVTPGLIQALPDRG